MIKHNVQRCSCVLDSCSTLMEICLLVDEVYILFSSILAEYVQ